MEKEKPRPLGKRGVALLLEDEVVLRHPAAFCLLAGTSVQKQQNAPAAFPESAQGITLFDCRFDLLFKPRGL
jgi:hypothetical protein